MKHDYGRMRYHFEHVRKLVASDFVFGGGFRPVTTAILQKK